MSDSVYRIVTEKIIAQLEQGVAPWRKPWNAATEFPRSINGHRYRGINVFLLAGQGYTSPYWLSWNEINRRGGRIRTGEHGTLIVFWKQIKVTDEDSGESKTIPLLRYYRVWNLDQTVDVQVPKSLPAPAPHVVLTSEQRHHAAAAIVAAYPHPPTIREAGDAAWYRPADDLVNVPPRATFTDLDEYYSTLFHELGHSTAHSTRGGRDCDYVFGSHSYGREELVAEMTAAFLVAEAGIETTLANSAAYLASWITTIQEDVRAVVVAAGAAQRAADHILARTSPAAQARELAGDNAVVSRRMAA